MYGYNLWKMCVFSLFTVILSGCATQMPQDSSSPTEVSSNLPLFRGQAPYSSSFREEQYASRLPAESEYGQGKVIVVDPQKFAWGAYEDGKLVRAGIASAGADFCKDEGRPCRTTIGTFRVYSLGNEDCISRTYPLGKGGSLMPYCIFFNKGESLHGSPDQMMVEANISHGCIHMRIPDAEWLRYNFASIGTKVVIMPY